MTDPQPLPGDKQSGIAGLKDKASTSFAAFTPAQRTFIGGAAALVVVGVLAMSVFSGKPEMAPLMTGLEATDAQAVTAQLDSLGVPYELAGGGSTIMVPVDKVHQTRIDIASVEMPSSSKVGYGILDKTDLTSSEFSQQVNYQRAMEGELAKTIEAMSGVGTATVHLALPKNNTFALDEQAATASVMVKTEAGKSLAGSQVQAIVNLVSGGIENLDPSDVTVADANGKVLAAPGGTSGAGGGGDNQETTAAYEKSAAASIEAMLSSIVGGGKAKVTVSADLDYNSSKAISETYTAPSTIVPGEALAINESNTNETYDGAAAGQSVTGVLGTEGTNPTDGTEGTAAGGGYQLSESQKNNAVNKVTEETSKAPGAINRLSVAVVVDEDAVGPEQITELQTLVSAAAGLNPERGDTVAVSRFKLDDTEAKAMQEALAFREDQADSAATPIWMYVVGGVVLLGVIGAALRRRRGKKQDNLDIVQRELPPASDDLIVLGNNPAALQPVGAGAPALDANGVATDRREALGDLIDNQPDEVAELLRSWLGDRRETAR